MKKVAKDIKENSDIAKVFLAKIIKNSKNKKGALVVALSGELGAGKTSFTQAVAKHLGIKGKVSSPTFVLIKKYKIAKLGYKFLFHLDAYRLKNEKELLHLGWDEIISNKEHIVFLEWPEMVGKIVPRGVHKIAISHTKEGHRKFEF